MQDVNSATHVHRSLQGAVIPSSGSVGMRIQYPLCLCFLVHLFIYFFNLGRSCTILLQVLSFDGREVSS